VEVNGPKRAFLIEGDDRVGACADVSAGSRPAKINVTAMDAWPAGGVAGDPVGEAHGT